MPQPVPTPRARPFRDDAPGSGQGRPEATRDLLGYLFLGSSLAPPAEADLQLLSQEWVPSWPRPASQPVAATCWTAQPWAGRPESFQLSPPSRAQASPTQPPSPL